MPIQPIIRNWKEYIDGYPNVLADYKANAEVYRNPNLLTAQGSTQRDKRNPLDNRTYKTASQ